MSQKNIERHNTPDMNREVMSAVLEHALARLGFEYDSAFVPSRIVVPSPGAPWHLGLIQSAQALELEPTHKRLGLGEALATIEHHEGVLVTYFEGTWYLLAKNVTRQRTITRINADGLAEVMTEKSAHVAFDSRQHEWIYLQNQLSMQRLRRDKAKNPGGARGALERFRSLIFLEKESFVAILIYAVFMGVVGLLTPLAVQALVNTISFGMVVQPLILLAIVLLVGLSFVGILRVLQHLVVEYLQRRLFIRFMTDLATRLPRTRHQVHEHYHMPELVNRFFDVATVQKSLSLLLLDSLGLILQMVLGMLVLAFYHPYLLAFDVVLILAVLFVIFVLGRGAIKTSIKESDAKYAVAAWLEEIASHPLSFKSTHGKRFARTRAEQLATSWLNARSRHFRVLLRQIVGAVLVQAIASAALLGLGGWLVLKGQLTLGQLVAAELIVTTVAASVGKMGKHLETYYDVVTGVHKMGKILDLPLEHRTGQPPIPTEDSMRLELRQVGVTYGTGSCAQLGFVVEPGERVVITGQNNSELSALVETIYGLRTPTCGTILFDHVAHNEWSMNALRDHISLVREVDVFDGTIEENLRLGRRELTPTQIREALSAVGLLDEIRTFPDGIETHLQSRGRPLSSDQLGRLMIARAMLQNPRLILIDRALDKMHPSHIKQALDVLFDKKHNWSLLVVSHRPEILACADRVMTMTTQGMTRFYQGADGEAE